MPPFRLPTTDPLDVGNAPGAGPLRAGGQGLPESLLAEHDLPSTPCHAAKCQWPALKIVRDLAAGNERLQEEGPTYLPKAPGEDMANYRVRLARATLFNAFLNTVRGLVGFMFRNPPALMMEETAEGQPAPEVPPILAQHWENIDLAGTHGEVFARELATDAMVAGHAAVLVDFPQTDGQQTLADEIRGNIRPYWVPIHKDNLVSWRTANENGVTVLTQLVVKEVTYEAAGAFGDMKVERYRVFYREQGVVGFQLLRITDDRRVLLEAAGTYPTQAFIPISEIITAGRRSLFESDPPLLDLAYLNLAHYRQWSDYDTSIHKTCVPILFTAGVQTTDEAGRDLVIGPNTAISALDPAAKAEYVSHSGEALAACKASLDDLENRMGALGLAALATSKRVAETATAKELDKGASDSALAVTARGVQDGLERAWEFHARYLGLPAPSVEMHDDYNEQVMDAATMSAWANLATALALPPRVVIEALIDGGRLKEDTDVLALEQEMLAAEAAAAEQQRTELQMTLAAKAKQPMMPGAKVA